MLYKWQVRPLHCIDNPERDRQVTSMQGVGPGLKKTVYNKSSAATCLWYAK